MKLMRALLVVLLGLAVLGELPTTTSASDETSVKYVYDGPAIARLDVPLIDGAETRPTRPTDVREASAPPSVDGRGTSTTSPRSVLATEAESGAMSQMERVGSGLKDDPLHRATSWVVDDPAAQRFTITGGDGVPRTLYQLPGEVNGKPGVFEWIVDSSGTDSVITHQRFIPGCQVTGLPNQP